MADVFSQVLNMSMTGSLVIGLVLLARLPLRRSPKIFSYLLWSVVLFRLLCPVSLSAPISALALGKPTVREATVVTSALNYLPAPAPELSQVPSEPQPEGGADTLADTRPSFPDLTACVWLVGAAAMLFYSAARYLRLRIRLIGAMAYRKNIYLADRIDTAFVIGLLRPRIYLPSHVPMEERRYIIAHERHHIRRLDHVSRLLAYLALCVHWFNPLVWAAFLLAGKDMEMSCDEAVIRKLGPQVRSGYSACLLRLTARRSIVPGMPLAFGEGDTKSRIRNMARWRTPTLWASVFCLLLCAAIMAACAVNPSATETGAPAADGMEDVQIGDLPAGYGYEAAENGDIRFTHGTDTVGGVTRYPIPQEAYDPNDTVFLWLEKVGIPDFEDPSLCYMGGTDAEGIGWEAEFASDVPEGVERTVQRRHIFYPSGDVVYDLWFDMLRLDYRTYEQLRGAVQLPHLPVEAEDDSAGAIAFEKCRAVMEAVQNGSYHIVSRQVRQGIDGPGDDSREYYGHDGDVLFVATLLSDAGANGSRRAYLSVGDSAFSNEGHQEEPGDIVWAPCDPRDYTGPWLDSFLWVRSGVTYVDTLTDETGESVMFRVDKLYEDREDYAPCYFVNFNFDPQGNFQSVLLQVNAAMDNAFTETESIISLDSEAVNETLQREYLRAAEQESPR